MLYSVTVYCTCYIVWLFVVHSLLCVCCTLLCECVLYILYCATACCTYYIVFMYIV